MAQIELIGMDPSLRHWGLAKALYDTQTKKLEVTELDVIEYVPSSHKQVRQNSKDLDAATAIAERVSDFCGSTRNIFVEIPIGSQSARSMASYGICLGIIGAMQKHNTPIAQITPTEVKLASCGNSTASKRDMILWGLEKHPEAPWPSRKVKGVDTVIESKAEHMADAIAAIYAGIRLPEFIKLVDVINTYEK